MNGESSAEIDESVLPSEERNNLERELGTYINVEGLSQIETVKGLDELLETKGPQVLQQEKKMIEDAKNKDQHVEEKDDDGGGLADLSQNDMEANGLDEEDNTKNAQKVISKLRGAILTGQISKAEDTNVLSRLLDEDARDIYDAMVESNPHAQVVAEIKFDDVNKLKAMFMEQRGKILFNMINSCSTLEEINELMEKEGLIPEEGSEGNPDVVEEETDENEINKTGIKFLPESGKYGREEILKAIDSKKSIITVETRGDNQSK